jgi:DhnA family fructose-bisphosphate aldolase class Ia
MSSITGKAIRLKRLIEPRTGTCVVCALDHGMTAPRLPQGLVELETRARQAIAGGANVLMLGVGMAQRVVEHLQPSTALALMLSASAAGRPEGPVVTPINSVEWAVRLGADAVVVYVALSGPDEKEMIHYVAQVAEACYLWGVPFIAEAEFPNAYTTITQQIETWGPEYLMRNARLCAELGADIVKVNWSGDEDSFARIVDATRVPVILAGGPVIDDLELLKRMEKAMRAGAIGCSVGRNIFEHPNPEAMTRALCRVIRDRWPAEDALAELRAIVAAGPSPVSSAQ